MIIEIILIFTPYKFSSMNKKTIVAGLAHSSVVQKVWFVSFIHKLVKRDQEEKQKLVIIKDKLVKSEMSNGKVY